jgi:hypothetical protein
MKEPTAWGFMAGMFLPVALATAMPGKHVAPELLSPVEIDAIAYAKCGPDGTVDWDPNPQFPPPHCNRNGWNGRRYVETKDKRHDHR